jgi:predicted nicotinamide N-methyase
MRIPGLLRVAEGNPAQHPGGDSGAVVWAAAPLLARFLWEIPTEELDGRVAIELGCGVGLPSLTLALRGVRNVIATDGDQGVLEKVTRVNVDMNADLFESCPTLQRLPWGDPEAVAAVIASCPTLASGTPALIVASDVLYDAHGDSALALTLRTFAEYCPSARVLLAWQARHVAREQAFFESLADIFLCTPLIEEPCFDFFSDRPGSLHLVELSHFARSQPEPVCNQL